VDDSRHPEPERVHSDTGKVLASAENEEWNGNLVPKSQRVEAKRKLIGLQLCAEAMLDECERVRTDTELTTEFVEMSTLHEGQKVPVNAAQASGVPSTKKTLVSQCVHSPRQTANIARQEIDGGTSGSQSRKQFATRFLLKQLDLTPEVRDSCDDHSNRPGVI